MIHLSQPSFSTDAQTALSREHPDRLIRSGRHTILAPQTQFKHILTIPLAGSYNLSLIVPCNTLPEHARGHVTSQYQHTPSLSPPHPPLCYILFHILFHLYTLSVTFFFSLHFAVERKKRGKKKETKISFKTSIQQQPLTHLCNRMLSELRLH